MVDGKLLGVETVSRYCQGCVNINVFKNTDDEKYNRLKADHVKQCKINHEGSAPSMEAAGASSMFGRSIETHGLRYTQFYGVFFSFFSLYAFFFSGTKHPREDNPNLYYRAEMTGLHTQTFNI